VSARTNLRLIYAPPLDEVTASRVPITLDDVVIDDEFSSARISKRNNNLLRDWVDGLSGVGNVHNRAGNKLVNILTVCPNLLTANPHHFLTSHPLHRAILRRDYHKKLRVYDAAGGPGAWSSAMLNYPQAIVSGMTLANNGAHLDWYPYVLNNPRFHGVYGNLFTDSLNHIEQVNSSLFGGSNPGSDICLCDGGVSFEMFNPGVTYVASQHRHLNVKYKCHLMVIEALVSITSNAINGHTIIKLFEIANPVVMDVITVLISCYQQSIIIKLITTRRVSHEIFFIGLYRKSQVNYQKKILQHVLSNWEELYPSRLVIPDQAVEAYIRSVHDIEMKSYQDARDRCNQVINQVMTDYNKIRHNMTFDTYLENYLKNHVNSESRVNIVTLSAILNLPVISWS
jgi:hypothetical protein